MDTHEQRLHDAILALYRGCRDIAIADFKEWAMETARHAVAFDSGIWVTSDIVSNGFNSVYLFHQPYEMMENYYQAVRLSEDPLAEAALARPGTSCIQNFFGSVQGIAPAIIDHTKRFGMASTQCTCYVSPITNITTFISFYREDSDHPFTESDRRTKELLVPHMIEAMRINLFTCLHDGGSPAGGGALAVCDCAGMLYEATPRFGNAMREAWPEWTGPKLKLPCDLLTENGGSWSQGGLRFEANPCRDLFLVRVRRENVLEQLSPRQREVAEMLARGKRYKDIARTLAISPSTVTNHVNQIHSRLGIGSREELLALFQAARY